MVVEEEEEGEGEGELKGKDIERERERDVAHFSIYRRGRPLALTLIAKWFSHTRKQCCHIWIIFIRKEIERYRERHA